jgi:GAF domain-containing protein
MALTFLPFQWLLSISAIRGVYRELRRQRNWEKTAHVGAHRQSEIVSALGFERLLKEAFEHLGVERGSVMALNFVTNTFSILTSRGLPKTVIDSIRVPADKGVVGWVARTKQPVIIDGRAVPHELASQLTQPGLRSSVVLPIVQHDTTIAVLSVSSTQVTLGDDALHWLQDSIQTALSSGAAIRRRNPVQGLLGKPAFGTVKLGALWPLVSKQAVARPAPAVVPKQSHTVHSWKLRALLPTLIALLIGLSAGTSLWSFAAYQISRAATPPSALLDKTIPYSSPRPTGAPTPTLPSLASANLVVSYYGTIYDAAANTATMMSLTRIQQSQGAIHGYFTGLHMDGPFRGIIDASKHIQFTVTDSAGLAVLSFEGSMQSDGKLAGRFCILNQKGQCAGEYGVWSTAPALFGG